MKAFFKNLGDIIGFFGWLIVIFCWLYWRSLRKKLGFKVQPIISPEMMQMMCQEIAKMPHRY